MDAWAATYQAMSTRGVIHPDPMWAVESQPVLATVLVVAT